MARGKKTGGRDFQRGNKASNGRPKGALDRLTKLAVLIGTDRESLVKWYERVSQDPAYRESLLGRIAIGEASAMERLLAEQVYGKPVDVHRFESDKPVVALILMGDRKDPLAALPLPAEIPTS